jgi:ATP-dependent RNA helicase DHX8/PRP22
MRPLTDIRIQVCVELENHIGMADKDLAEFVIHLALESDGAAAFKSALASNGAVFPSAFAERLHEMVKRPRTRASYIKHHFSSRSSV